jgi:hypothetical protein
MTKLARVRSCAWKSAPRVPPVRAKVASQHCCEHSRGPKAHALAKLLPPGAIRNLFGDDSVGYRDDLMDKPTMQALAMGCQLAFFFRLASPRVQIQQARLTERRHNHLASRIARARRSCPGYWPESVDPSAAGDGGGPGYRGRARCRTLPDVRDPHAARWQQLRDMRSRPTVSLPTTCLGLWLVASSSIKWAK